MILKYKNDFTEVGWFIIDSIAEISYSWIKKGEEINTDRHFDAKNQLSKDWIQILITFKDRREEVHCTSVTTFLLNDNGKTIERIL